MSYRRNNLASSLFALTLCAVAGSNASVAWGQSAGASLAKAGNVRVSRTTESQNMDPTKAPEATKPKVKVSEFNTVDLHVKDEDLANVLELLSIQGQKNIIVSKNVTGKVTMNLYGVTFYEALDALLHSNGFAYVERGNFVYVYTVEELEKLEKAFRKRVAKKIYLNYLNAPDAAKFVEGMLSKEGEIKTTPKTEAYTVGDSPVGKDDLALGAILVVTDYEENIKAIEALLGELDTKPAQVLIEATVLQAKLTEDNAFGVDFAWLESVNFSDFSTILAGPRAVADALLNGGGNGQTGVSPQDNTGSGLSLTPGRTNGASTMKFGIVYNNIAAFVKLLDDVTDTTVLANPKLLALNRQPARVLVGRKVAYLSTTATETSTTQTVQYLDTGVQLYVRPFVSQSGDIRLEIKPQVSTAEVREIKAQGGGVVTVPDEITQEVTTNIIVPDGMTVVIGGLFSETTVATRSQVPGLGELPIIGNAFRGQSDSTTRDEIIFLVTPTIVEDRALIAQGEQARGVEQRIRAGVRQGQLPWSRTRQTQQLNVQAEAAAREGNYELALMNINRSLGIMPRNEDALRLRDRILGEREVWPTGSIMPGVIGTGVRDRMLEINQPADKPNYSVPNGFNPLPRTKLNNPALQASAPTPAATQQLPGWEKIEHLFTPSTDNQQIAGQPLFKSPEEMVPSSTPTVPAAPSVVTANIATPKLPAAQPTAQPVDTSAAKALPPTLAAGAVPATPAPAPVQTTNVPTEAPVTNP